MLIKADLHIHTVLSPCGSFDMSPRNIISRVKALNLDAIAISDHNTIYNAPAVKEIGEKEGVKVFYGMEAQTIEEVHILTLFEDWKRIEAFYSEIYPHLPNIENDPDYFGDQIIVDKDENVIGEEKKLLANSLELSIEELVELVLKYGGFVIPSHIERERYGLLTNLYKVPDILKDSIMEISYNANLEEIFKFYPFLKSYSLISNSDAHYPDDIGRAYTEYEVSEINLKQIYKAAKEGKYRVIRK